MNFRDFGLVEPLVRAVTQEGYSTPTPIQQQAIPAVLSGRDVVGIAQTGTGKTAAFALPLLHQIHLSADRRSSGVRRIQVLVLASTRELAIQIHESFMNYGAFASVRVATMYGGVGQQPQVRALKAGVDIVVATPGRLLDLMQQGYVNLEGLRILVLDEADRMLDMGFFPAIRRILQRIPKKRQTLMFSATMKPEIRELADSMLHDPVSISIEPKKKTTELVQQTVCIVPQKQKTRVLIELIQRMAPSRTIVFSRTKHGADRIVRHLNQAGLRSEAIHANKSQNKRQRILEEFKSTQPPILVATDIASRGIDVDQVSHVFNHDMPTEEETYVHRIGRSGRAGATGVAVSLCDPEERRMLKSIEKLIGFAIPQQSLEGIDLNSLPAESGSRDERSGGDDQRERRHGGPGNRQRRSSADSSSRRNDGQGERSRRPPASAEVSDSGARRFHGHEARRRQDETPGSGGRHDGNRERRPAPRSGADTMGGSARPRPRSEQRPAERNRADSGRGERSAGGRSDSGAAPQFRPRSVSHRPVDSDFGDGIFQRDRERERDSSGAEQSRPPRRRRPTGAPGPQRDRR
jgi:ATP-dependent RNA helicase RhlE